MREWDDEHLPGLHPLNVHHICYNFCQALLLWGGSHIEHDEHAGDDDNLHQRDGEAPHHLLPQDGRLLAHLLPAGSLHWGETNSFSISQVMLLTAMSKKVYFPFKNRLEAVFQALDTGFNLYFSLIECDRETNVKKIQWMRSKLLPHPIVRDPWPWKSFFSALQYRVT